MMRKIYNKLPGVPSPLETGNQHGFSVIELLIALLITGIVVSAGFNLYLTQHEGWLIQEQITDMQQNARVAMHELETRIRMAGYELPGGIQPIYSADTNPDTITVVLRSEFLCESTIEHPMPQPSAELRCDGHDISCFKESTWAYIYDPFADTGEFFFITEVQVAAMHIQHHIDPLSRCYPQGSTVTMINMFKFYIDTTDANHPNLVVQREGNQSNVYAENIEDLQFRFGLANGVFVDVPPAASVVREVMITLTARTARKDLQLQGEYRRRTLTSDVKVRNLSLGL